MSVSFDPSIESEAFEPGTVDSSERRRRLKRVASQHESDIDICAGYVLSRTDYRPKIGIVAGVGISGFTKVLVDKEVIQYEDIPGFPQPITSGPSGELYLGKCCEKEVVIFEGRFFFHEGYDPTTCAMTVRMLKRMGVEVIITTGVCGALNETYRAGDLVVVKDQLNFPGFACENPMRGYKDDKTGKRFVAMSDAFNADLRKLALSAAKEVGFGDMVHEGIYALIPGPTYETNAEARMIRMLGADVCGMSMCHEVIVARHCEMRVLGISLVTNMIVLEYEDPRAVTHGEVLRTGNSRRAEMRKFLSKIIQKIEV